MAMPASHLIALCGDFGFAPGRGATLLTVLLVCSLFEPAVLGLDLSTGSGGLKTLLVGSLAQATAISGFILTQDEMGLLAVAAAFGLGFSGLIPAYIVDRAPALSRRRGELAHSDPAAHGHVRHGRRQLVGGRLYDYFGFYAPAFATGLFFNLINASIIAGLLLLWRQSQHRLAFP